MTIRNLYSLLTLGTLASVALSGCSSDSDNPSIPDEPRYRLVTFETSDIILAGPTSYGANLYSDFNGQKFTRAEIPVTPDGVKMQFGLNVSSYTNKPEFYGGGMVLSRWNIYKNPATEENPDWWKSYLNQCSVYNGASVSGSNSGAGGDGSNTFAVINGCDQSKYNPSLQDNCAEITFSDYAELTVQALQVAPTAYVYGCISGPNPMGSNWDIMAQNGYFCVKAYGYDASGQPTNGGNPVTYYFCDYRPTARPVIHYSQGWEVWSLAELGKVNKIRFDFDGSDVGQYGLNTPAYACFDNILIEFGE